MLSLTRGIGQSLRIDDDTIITVVDSGAGEVVLKIISEKTITVDGSPRSQDIPRHNNS